MNNLDSQMSDKFLKISEQFHLETREWIQMALDSINTEKSLR